MIPEEFGPTVLEQTVAPPVPETVQDMTPAGATAPVTPVTVAVTVTVPPSVGVGEDVSAIVGAGAVTIVVVDEATGATALYALSPGNVNVAP